MLNPISVNLDSVRQDRAPMPIDAVNNVFKVMHGFYGNLFLSKFATGEVDGDGQDKGIVSARQIWGHGLRGFNAATVKAALAQCVERHPEYAPSLPQFIALCKANEPRGTFADGQKAIGMGQELVSRYARQARAINLKHAAAEIAGRVGFMEIPAGLDGLKLAIADAVGCAGGDEARELTRLNRIFTGAST